MLFFLHAFHFLFISRCSQAHTLAATDRVINKSHGGSHGTVEEYAVDTAALHTVVCSSLGLSTTSDTRYVSPLLSCFCPRRKVEYGGPLSLFNAAAGWKRGKKKRWKEGVVVFGRKVTILVRGRTEMEEGK